jgi:hypothetical protein
MYTVRQIKAFGDEASPLGLYDGFIDRVLDAEGNCVYAFDKLAPAHQLISAQKVQGRNMADVEKEYLPRHQRPKLTEAAQDALRIQQKIIKSYSLFGLRRLVVVHPLTDKLALARIWIAKSPAAAAKETGWGKQVWAFTSFLMAVGSLNIA